MIPIGDENPTLRTPVMTYLLLGALIATWIVFQGAGFDEPTLAASASFESNGRTPPSAEATVSVGVAAQGGGGSFSSWVPGMSRTNSPLLGGGAAAQDMVSAAIRASEATLEADMRRRTGATVRSFLPRSCAEREDRVA